MKKSLVLFMLIALWSVTATAADKFRVAWSHYTGWEPWAYAQNAGILKKWAAKHGIEIELTLINDYVESINLYTGGKFDACAMTNMDALTIPAVGGIDTTALIVGSFSNGNDGIVLKQGNTVKDLKGRSVKLVEFSVSHYLLARALAMNGMTEREVRTFTFSKGLFGKGAKSKDFIGIQFPDKSILGDAKNVKLRFDAGVMQLAADGKL